MNTVRWAMDQLGVDEAALLKVLAPAQYAGVCVLGVEGHYYLRQLYDFGQVENTVLGRGFSAEEARTIVDSLVCCDGTCEGCIANDGRGCYAISLFHIYCDTTIGLPMPPHEAHAK